MRLRKTRLTLAILLAGMAATCPARGQTIGYGASPGRAAYRPQAQWNNGPFYTTQHVNPYAPHPIATTNLYAVEPLVPPYTSGPHGVYSPFYPGIGRLYDYSEGFSPYSGFAPWYQATYRINPSRELVQQARSRFFRSAPRPPFGVLPPLPPPRLVTVAPSRPEPSGVTQARVVEAGRARPAAGVRVYRSSVAGIQ